jgi:uncharacterized lipoprotein YddW (UPF0748 family)
MRRATALLCVALPATLFAKPTEPPAFPREMRAAWVATVANIDWPSSKGRSEVQQQKEALAILNKAADLRLNAIFLQVRPACDALYESKLDPWSEYLTGTMGDPVSYDPLQFWITEGHKRGIEIHAWFNPYRARLNNGIESCSLDHIANTKPEIVKRYGNDLWLDPGEQATMDYSYRVILDVVERYDIDGVHFDDYFYPYPVAGESFPDEGSYARYLDTGGSMTKAEWRRSNVDTFIERVHGGIKALKPWVKFGISPFGIWRPGYPAGVNGLDAYTTLYADAREWLQSGWVDYLSPQLYWKLDAPKQPYRKLLQWWTEQNTLGRNIWPGNFTSKIGDGFSASEILNQISATRQNPGATGNVHFSMRALMLNRGGIANSLAYGAYAAPALVPGSPWLDAAPPAPPTARLDLKSPMTTRVSWTQGAEEQPWLWTVYVRYGTKWFYEVMDSRATFVEKPSRNQFGELNAVAVAAVDRCGNESQRALLDPVAAQK